MRLQILNDKSGPIALWLFWAFCVVAATVFWLVVASVASAEAYTSFLVMPGVVDSTHPAPISTSVNCGTSKGGPYPLTQAMVVPTPSPAPSLPYTPPPVTLPFFLTTNGTYYCVATASTAVTQSGFSPEITVPVGAPNIPTVTAQ